MADKRYRVTVEFAHGVRHEWEVDSTLKEDLGVWMLGGRDYEQFVKRIRAWGALCKFEHQGKTYYLNRDYVCSMVVEEIPSERDTSRRSEARA